MKKSEQAYWQQYIRERVKVNKRGCWVWQLSLGTWGYGQTNGHMYGLTTCAHRLSYEAFVGPIPKGKLIRHQCHNRPCCNPAHLLPGTRKDNVDDNRKAKLRTGNDRLTPKQVREIRKLRANGHKLKELGAAYGVDHTTISMLALGKTWAHVK